MIRRAVALLTSVFTFHLMLVGSDLVCASHGSHQLSGDSRMASMPDMPASTRPDGSGGNRPPCDVPGQPGCCQGMASCAVSVAVSTETAGPSAFRVQTGIAATVFRAPDSRVAAPEPPPPKP